MAMATTAGVVSSKAHLLEDRACLSRCAHASGHWALCFGGPHNSGLDSRLCVCRFAFRGMRRGSLGYVEFEFGVDCIAGQFGIPVWERLECRLGGIFAPPPSLRG
jgi:hypothetical protein